MKKDKDPHFLSFSNFNEISDCYRDYCNKKPLPFYQKIVAYPFYVLIVGIAIYILVGLLDEIKNQPEHKNPKKYKKVVKEGVLFTTYEYHER